MNVNSKQSANCKEINNIGTFAFYGILQTETSSQILLCVFEENEEQESNVVGRQVSSHVLETNSLEKLDGVVLLGWGYIAGDGMILFQPHSTTFILFSYTCRSKHCPNNVLLESESITSLLKRQYSMQKKPMDGKKVRLVYNS